MDCFLSWEGNDVARQISLASLADDSGKVRQIAQLIDNANKIWHSWLESAGGSVICIAGDVGKATIPASRLSELAKIRDQFAEAIDSEVSVGVGMQLSQADKALNYNKLYGGKEKITLYTPEIEQKLNDEKQSQDDGVEKIAASLTKSWSPAGPEILDDGMSSPALNPAVGGGGATGAHRGIPPSKPQGEASQHSQGEAMRSVMEEENPGTPEMTHAASDLEDQLHQFAETSDKQDSEQQQQEKDAKDHTDSVKEQIVQVLQQVKQQAPVLEQIKQQAPKVYEAVMNMVQAVILMAKELPQNKPAEKLQKSETLEKEEEDVGRPISGVAALDPGKKLDPKILGPIAYKDWKKYDDMMAQPEWGPTRKWYNYSHLLSPANRKDGYLLVLLHQPRKDRFTGEEGSHNLEAHLYNKNNHYSVGTVTGSVYANPYLSKFPGSASNALSIKLADIGEDHRGKGLGQAAYKALFAHAYHYLEAQKVIGGEHSSYAHKAHQKLSRDLGLNYEAGRNYDKWPQGYTEEWEEGLEKPSSFDERFEPYQYTLKSENLQKMALIHRDENNPVIVYRIANNYGEGPYRPKMGSGVAMRATVDKPGETFSEFAERQPGPVQDFARENWYGHQPYEGDMIYGFKSPKDALDWFGKETIDNMAQEGYHLREVPALQVHESHSGRQVVFLPHPAYTRNPHKFPPISQEHWQRPRSLLPWSRFGRVMLKSEKEELMPEEPIIESKTLDKKDLKTEGLDSKQLSRRIEDFDPKEVKIGMEVEKEHTQDPKELEKIVLEHLVENEHYYTKLKAAGLAKEQLPDKKVAEHHHLTLPPGSQIDASADGGRKENSGHIKVQKPSGKTQWREVRANMVLDPYGNPTSSLRPGGSK